MVTGRSHSVRSGGRSCRQPSELVGVVACMNIDIAPFAEDVASFPSQGTGLRTLTKPSSRPGLPVDLGTLQIIPEAPAFDFAWYLRS